MIKICVISPGKIKEAWLEAAINEYLKRLAPLAAFNLIWTRQEKEFLQLVEEEKHPICLDVKGQEMDSHEFASFFFNRVELGGSRITFAIGGPEGFPPGFTRERLRISFSKMTFTHQMARLLLMEQIFRSFEIRRGSRYHRD